MSASESIPGGSEPGPASGHTDRSAATSSSGLARSAGVVGAATMTSRVLGLVREQVLAYWFGASDSMDAFLVAFRVPNLVRDLFAEGAMSAALVPTFSRTLATDGRARAWRLGNSVMNALVAVTGVLVLAAIVFAPQLVTWLAGDFAAVPGKFELTVLLTRIMAPFLVLVAVAAACMGMLNSLNVFFIPALSPAMFNVASIAVGVGLVPVAIGAGIEPILAMAAGTIVGGLGQVLLQWPALRARALTRVVVVVVVVGRSSSQSGAARVGFAAHDAAMPTTCRRAAAPPRRRRIDSLRELKLDYEPSECCLKVQRDCARRRRTRASRRRWRRARVAFSLCSRALASAHATQSTLCVRCRRAAQAELGAPTRAQICARKSARRSCRARGNSRHAILLARSSRSVVVCCCASVCSARLVGKRDPFGAFVAPRAFALVAAGRLGSIQLAFKKISHSPPPSAPQVVGKDAEGNAVGNQHALCVCVCVCVCVCRACQPESQRRTGGVCVCVC